MLIGIGLSLPVLLVIVPLLVSSDAAFESLVTLVLKKAGAYIAEIVLTVIITPILLFYAVSKNTAPIFAQRGANTLSGEWSKARVPFHFKRYIAHVSCVSVFTACIFLQRFFRDTAAGL